MSVSAIYLPSGEVEYIGDCDHGTLWFHLDPKTGKSKFFDDNGNQIERPVYTLKESLFKLVFGDDRTDGRFP